MVIVVVTRMMVIRMMMVDDYVRDYGGDEHDDMVVMGILV